MTTPTRFTRGLTTVAKTAPLGMFGLPDPTKYSTYFNDFHTFNAGDWTITTTEAGGGNATEAITDANGGVLLITNDAADDDNDFLQLSGETFKFIAGKKLWFKTRFKVSDATQSDILIGLQIRDTTPMAVTDSVYFSKTDGLTDLYIRAQKDSSTTFASIATIVSNTYITVAFYYNGVDGIQYYVNDVHGGTLATTNLPDDEELTVSFGIQNGEAVAKTMSIDYIFVSTER